MMKFLSLLLAVDLLLGCLFSVGESFLPTFVLPVETTGRNHRATPSRQTDWPNSPRRGCSQKSRVSVFGVPEVSIAESTLWTLRVVSAVSGYVGFVAYFDRPRGKLEVEIDRDIEIKSSTVPGAGLGLYAKTSMPKGTVLGTYPGAVIPLSQNLEKLKEYPACEGYIWRFSDNKAVIDPTNAKGVLDPTCTGGNPSMPGSTMLLQSVLRPFFSVSTALCRINEPPRGMDVNVVTSEDREKRQVLFELERSVIAGEELFIDYGLSYDRSMYGAPDQ